MSMRPVAIVGVGMTPFGQLPDRSLVDLSRAAIWDAIEDAGVDPRRIDIAYVGNCYAGILQDQESARAVTIVRNAGLGGMAMTHVESGTTSATMALHGAYLAVGSGEYDLALAVGVEKLYIPGDVNRSIAAISTSLERFIGDDLGLTPLAQLWMEVERTMDRYGWTIEDVARVAEKSHRHASLNPRAESRTAYTLQEILEARRIFGPITRPMCASAAIDGAAAAILCSEELARSIAARTVRIDAFATTGGRWMDAEETLRRPTVNSMTLTADVFAKAYEKAGLGPEDLDLLETHDAMAAEELVAYEAVGLCAPGDGAALVRAGRTALGGDIPCNPDGGMLARGHPVGASGLAQVCEAVWQLRGDAGARQIRHEGDRLPRVAGIQNVGAQAFSGGGGVGSSVAVLLVR